MPDSSSHVTTDRVGDVVVITMDDGKVNALSKTMIADIKAAVLAADADDSVAAVVLAGREGKFCAGFDLSVMQSGVLDDIVDLVADGGDLVATIYGCGVPVVAASTGHSLAAGALLLLGCDVRIAADGPFKIGLNEVAIGMTLPEWALTIAKERISKRHLQRSIPNARITSPTDAIDVGFLDTVVPADQLMDTAIAEAAALAGLDRNAYRRTMSGFRGETIDKMKAEIASDRASGVAV